MNREGTLARCKTDDSFAPAIAMYAEGKAVKVCPAYVAKIQSEWQHAIADADRVFIIGTRVNEADGHIWQPLGQTRAPVTYFGLANDDAEFLAWKSNAHKQNATYIQATFAESIRHIRLA